MPTLKFEVEITGDDQEAIEGAYAEMIDHAINISNSHEPSVNVTVYDPIEGELSAE